MEKVKNSPPFAVIVSDYRMPEMNGLQLLGVLQKISPDSVRIILTGYADLQMAVDAINHNLVFRFLLKPTSHDDLLRHLNEAVEYYNILKYERSDDRDRSQFLSVVSHEMKSPLTAILNSTYILEEFYKQKDSANFNLYIGKVRTSISKMSQLIEQVLNVGRLEFLDEQTESAPFNLINNTKIYIDEIQILDENKHPIVFSCDLSEDFEVKINENLYHLIIRNLMTNAIKYSPAASEILLSIAGNDNEIAIKIDDKGIGIPPNDMEKIFEPFHRCYNISNQQGSGLGLLIVKRCVDVLKGNIILESQLNIGTTFTVTIPLI